MKVSLTDAEWFIGRYLAEKRHTSARENGIEDRKAGPQSDMDTDLGGIYAEMVYCKAHNLYPDLDYGHRPTCDAVHPDGTTVDVKYTKYTTDGHLLVALWKKNKKCDRYALVVGGFPVFDYVGYATADEIFLDENITDFGYGDVYALPQDKLHKEDE